MSLSLLSCYDSESESEQEELVAASTPIKKAEAKFIPIQLPSATELFRPSNQRERGPIVSLLKPQAISLKRKEATDANASVEADGNSFGESNKIARVNKGFVPPQLNRVKANIVTEPKY